MDQNILNVSWHPCLKHIFSKNLPKGRAQRVPSTQHFYRYPTRFSFENLRVSGNTKYQVLPGISGIPLNTKKHGNTQHNLRCLRVNKVPEPARRPICHERRDQWLCKKNFQLCIFISKHRISLQNCSNMNFSHLFIW